MLADNQQQKLGAKVLRHFLLEQLALAPSTTSPPPDPPEARPSGMPGYWMYETSGAAGELLATYHRRKKASA